MNLAFLGDLRALLNKYSDAPVDDIVPTMLTFAAEIAKRQGVPYYKLHNMATNAIAGKYLNERPKSGS